MRRSGTGSVLFSHESCSISFDQMKFSTTCKPFDMRFSTRTLRLLKFELPAVRLCSTTPELNDVESPATVNCGKGASNRCRFVSGPFRLPEGFVPANGFAFLNEAVSASFTALSRCGAVLRYWRGMALSCVTEIGRWTAWLP